MDWRHLLAAMVIHFLAILRSRKVDFYRGDTCFILDDTTAEKTTKKAERVSRVFGHVVCKCVLGYKVQILCVSDGVTTIPVDFSIHREKGEKGDYGLMRKERRKQFHKKRDAASPAAQRLKETDRNKLYTAIEMVARAWKMRIRPAYVLADSWYLSEKLLRGVLEIGKGALHFLGMAKMGSTKYKVEGRLLDAASLIARYERTRHHECREYHCWYIKKVYNSMPSLTTFHGLWFYCYYISLVFSSFQIRTFCTFSIGHLWLFGGSLVTVRSMNLLFTFVLGGICLRLMKRHGLLLTTWTVGLFTVLLWGTSEMAWMYRNYCCPLNWL